MNLKYQVLYLNESADTLPSANLVQQINAQAAQGWQLIFKPVPIAVDDEDGAQKVDDKGNSIWVWECWFQSTGGGS